MGFFSFFKGNKAISSTNNFGIFVPIEKGFQLLTEGIANSSINGISEHLGYHPDQLYTYSGGYNNDPHLLGVIVEIFTSNIVFVLTSSNVTTISTRRVKRYLREFTVQDEFNSYKTKTILENGIENESLTVEYLSRVLNIQDASPYGMNTINSLGLYLEFTDGFLSGFQSADGLNEWAKSWKKNHPTFIEAYENVSRLYWGNNHIRQILNEINVQADAWANVPNAMSNEFIELHYGELGTINFLMLLVCHYNHKITFSNFHEVNYGRYQEFSKNLVKGCKCYRLGKFTYEFAENGILEKVYLNEQ